MYEGEAGTSVRCDCCGHEMRAAARSCARCGAPVFQLPGSDLRNDGPGAGTGHATGHLDQVDRSIEDRTVLRRGLGPVEPPLRDLPPSPVDPPVSTPSQIPTHPEPYGSPPSHPPVGVTGSILNQSVPAGVGARFAATLLDGLIVGSGYLLTVLVHALGYTYLDFNVAQTVGYVAVVAYAAFSLTYYVGGWGHGQTLGKKALRIRVVDVRTGRSIGYGRAFGRVLMLSVMALPCYLGFLSIFGADGRGWHDKATDSWAVRSL